MRSTNPIRCDVPWEERRTRTRPLFMAPSMIIDTILKDGPDDPHRQTLAGVHLVVIGIPCVNCGGGPLNHPRVRVNQKDGSVNWCDCGGCHTYIPMAGVVGVL